MGEFKSVYVNNLPDVYRKDTDSNNYKILNIQKIEVDGIKKDTEDVYNTLDLDQATGKTLDLYGDMLGQARGYATDDQYRVMIKSRIVRNLMTGSLDSIITAGCLMFGCEPNEMHIIEDSSPAGVKVISLPYRVINYVGLSASQVIELIIKLVPVSITVKSAELQGTFEFGTTDSEYDEDKGFAISEADQSIGGYVGYIYSAENEQPLPI